jgi:hypothetical protein
VFRFSEIPIRWVNVFSIPDEFVLEIKSHDSGTSISSPISI